MSLETFFVDDKSKILSSSRLLFIIGGLLYIFCSSFCYVWYVLHSRTFDGATVTYLSGIVVLGGKITAEKLISAKEYKNSKSAKA